MGQASQLDSVGINTYHVSMYDSASKALHDLRVFLFSF